MSENTNTPQTPNVGLQDLDAAVKIIDYACDQGAFKGWEVINQVFGVRAKLAAFVAANTPKEEKTEKKEDTNG